MASLESDVVDLLDRPVAFHPSLAKLAGSVNAGLMLSQALYWSKRAKNPGGWFYKSQVEWEEETCLGRREQETARKLLRKTGFWEEKRQDSPARLYFRINRQALNAALFRMADSANLECRKPPIKFVANVHTPRAGSDLISENTTETTPVKRSWGDSKPEPVASDVNYLALTDFLRQQAGPLSLNPKERKAARRLAESEYDIDQCKRCFLYLRTQEWRETAVLWSTVEKEIGTWVRDGESTRSNGNGHAESGHPSFMSPPKPVDYFTDMYRDFEK